MGIDNLFSSSCYHLAFDPGCDLHIFFAMGIDNVISNSRNRPGLRCNWGEIGEQVSLIGDMLGRSRVCKPVRFLQ